MSRGRLTVALSSLLLFIFLVGLPTSEAIQCSIGGTCYYHNNTEGELTASSEVYYKYEECPDACYAFGCLVDGMGMNGWGCEAHLRIVCPNFTDADIAKLKQENNKTITWAASDTYFGLACTTGNCSAILRDQDTILAAVDPAEIQILQTAIAHDFNITAINPCNYTGDTGTPPENPTDNSTTYSLSPELVGVSNSTEPSTTDNAGTFHGVPMILEWIIVGWIAAQF